MAIINQSWAQRFVHQNARHHFFLSFGVAIATLPLMPHSVLGVVSSWDVFTICYLLMAAAAISGASTEDIKVRANARDPGRHFVFVLALAAACASLLAVLMLMKAAKDLHGAALSLHIGLSVVAVVGSWMVMHTIFAFRYAHMYYANCEGDAENTNDPAIDGHVGGLEFPGDEPPDYFDFAYFSFVIGMTFQVSDIEISKRALRRLALLHSVLAFAFNTMILALSVNIISGLTS